MALSKPSILDFEASGLGIDSYPIEVGIILADGRKYCTLIKPAHNWLHWDQSAEELHRISRGILLSYGKPIVEVANELNRLLAEKTIYSDGWVVDKPWLNKLFYHANLMPSFFLSPLENILSELQMALWSTSKQAVIEELALSRHRASTDALIIQETYHRTWQILQRKTDIDID
jgi:hypothetical protein